MQRTIDLPPGTYVVTTAESYNELVKRMKGSLQKSSKARNPIPTSVSLMRQVDGADSVVVVLASNRHWSESAKHIRLRGHLEGRSTEVEVTLSGTDSLEGTLTVL